MGKFTEQIKCRFLKDYSAVYRGIKMYTISKKLKYTKYARLPSMLHDGELVSITEIMADQELETIYLQLIAELESKGIRT